MVDEGDISGTTLAGRYRIERKLAAGGMGAVYVAVQDPLGREVALKVLKPALVGDRVAVERFKNEAKIVAQLNHPHIISIIELGTAEDGTLFIAMELLPGSPLGTILRERGPMPWQRSVNIVCAIARALGAAHARGVVHRDLKPDNVLIVDAHGMGDFVKVLDFGIAKLVRSEEHAPALTGAGFVPGTPGYIAPEQIMGGGTDDPRSDLYSLGVTWFEMLAGKRPYDGDSAMKIFMAHVQDPIPKLADRAPGIDVPPEIDRLLASLLAKDPAQRPKSAEAFIASVDALGLQVPPTPAHNSPLPRITTEISAQLPTMTSLSTPGTSVRAFIAAPATPATATAANAALAPATTAAATTAATTSPTTATTAATGATAAKATTAEQATIAKLLKERRFWIRFWSVAATFLVVIIVALGVVIHFFASRDIDDRSRRRAHLPVGAGGASPADRAISDAVQAFIDGDEARAKQLARDAAESFPDEPTPLLIEAAVSEPRRTEDRRGMVESAAKVAARLPSRTGDPDRAGIEIFPVIERAYDSRVGREDFARAFQGCGACNQSVVALAIAADAISLGRTDAAVHLVDKIIALEPEAGIGYAKKAQMLLNGGEVHEALVVAKAGLTHAPHSPSVLLVAARAYLAAGELGDAVKYAKSAAASVGLNGSLALADAYLLNGDEELRKRTIDGLRASANADEKCEIAVQHGPALVGALRPKDSLELMQDCLREKHVDPLELRSLLMVYSQAAEGADDFAFWDAVTAQKAEVPEIIATLQPKGVTVVIDGVVAQMHGDIETAQRKLAELKNADPRDPAYWPPNAAKFIIALLESRVEMALVTQEPEKANEHVKAALAAAELMEHSCRAMSRKIDILVAAHRIDEAKEQIARVLERRDLCRQSTHEGVYLAKALVLRAELDDKNPADAALRLKIDMRTLFPTADPDAAWKKRADQFVTTHP